MKKKTTEAIMQQFAECLRNLYAIADLEMPGGDFDPDLEAHRIALALSHGDI